MILKLITSLFLIVGIVCLLNLTPTQISEDLINAFNKRISLRERIHQLRSGKKKKTLGDKLIYTQNALKAMNKGNKFAFVVCTSLILIVVGFVTAVLINNIFLAPTFAVALAIVPFIYVKNIMDTYEKHIRDELETTLSIITTSYCRSENIIEAVRENLSYIRPPLREHFSSFVSEASFILNIKDALLNLRKRVDDEIYREWCDALLQCQEDSTLKDTLQPIIAKYTDLRVVNSELSSMMTSVRMEYYTMAGLVVGNIPLLYMLNKDWFHTLMYETAGKITLGVCGVVILVTYLFMLKFTKPIEYNG